MRDLRRELRRGTLELVLLRLLADRPTHGYELVKRLRCLGGDDFEVREGTLYPVLYRLEEAGWIVPEWVQPAAAAPGDAARARRVPRKVYRLSPAGDRRLDELTRAWRSHVDGVEAILSGAGAPPGEPDREEDR